MKILPWKEKTGAALKEVVVEEGWRSDQDLGFLGKSSGGGGYWFGF